MAADPLQQAINALTEQEKQAKKMGEEAKAAIEKQKKQINQSLAGAIDAPVANRLEAAMATALTKASKSSEASWDEVAKAIAIERRKIEALKKAG